MNEWISVKDRLPEVPDGKYAVGVIASILSEDDDYEPEWCRVTYRNNKFFMRHYRADGSQYEAVVYGVTHWMIPAPPKEGE